MGAQVSPATLQGLATRLAAAFGVAATSLAALESSAATDQAQIVLTSAILHARDAYRALASAAAEASSPGMAVARAHVYEAETSVDNALESFALLGYEQS